MTSPIEQRNKDDPGDATQRNYRYQYAYGVVLLVAAAMKRRDYRAIWCEQQEDFLCEIEGDDRFDAVQVKTQQPESGFWQTNTEAFVKSIKRFVELDTKYAGAIRRFAFVSNTEVLDTDAWKSPCHLLRGVRSASNHTELVHNAAKAFNQLKGDTEADDNSLFSVLKRLDLRKGPSREGFIAELTQNHVALLPACRGLTSLQIAELTEHFINLVERASSLSSQAPDRHDPFPVLDPQLQAKCFTVDQFKELAGFEISELKRTKAKLRWCLIAGIITYVLGLTLLPLLKWQQARERPVPLGEVSHVSMSYYVGNVAIPNRLERTENTNIFRLDTRQKYWDAYLITAPVPKVLQTTQGVKVTVPWTLLPQSVCETVNQLDAGSAAAIEEWLKLKNSTAEWHFDRLLRLTISPTNEYYLKTGIEAIYAINLFDFLNELGEDYQGSLARAISSATKEVVERSGSDNHRKVAIPALAAAQHVIEREMVLSYRESFVAILDGVRRAEGKKPSQSILVIWDAWVNRPEMRAAISGLERACFVKIESWKERLTWFVLITVFCSFIYGLAVNYIGRTGKGWPIKECVAALILGIFLFSVQQHVAYVLDALVLQNLALILDKVGLEHYHAICIAILCQVSAVLGYYLHGGTHLWTEWWERLRRRSESTAQVLDS